MMIQISTTVRISNSIWFITTELLHEWDQSNTCASEIPMFETVLVLGSSVSCTILKTFRCPGWF